MLEEAVRGEQLSKSVVTRTQQNSVSVGHIYSIMVEELGIDNPHLQEFVDRLQRNHTRILITQKSDLKTPLCKLVTTDHIQALSQVLVEDGLHFEKGLAYEKIMVEALRYKDNGVLWNKYFTSVDYVKRNLDVEIN